MNVTVTEINPAIEKLPPGEAKLSERLVEFEMQVWDERIKRDSQNDKLKRLIDEAEKDFVVCHLI